MGYEAICNCLEGYGGESCELTLSQGLDSSTCPSNCSGHGVCLDGKCFCDDDYHGESCSYMSSSCVYHCSGFGLCRSGCCDCIDGYKGVACGLTPDGELLPEEPICRNNCSGNGLCNPMTRRCECEDPWTYDDCSVLQEACPGDPQCSDRGDCILGRCVCDTNYTGDACEIDLAAALRDAYRKGFERGAKHNFYNSTVLCPFNCSGHGQCNGATGVCLCDEGYRGAGCEISDKPQGPSCPENCNGHGDCIDGQCHCYDAYYGVACENMNLPCPFLCSGKGICRDGICECFEGFNGTGCEVPYYTPRCANNCSGQGECRDGDCHCPVGFRGIDCSIGTGMCPNGCSGNGMCHADGTCHCRRHWSGADCSVKAPNAIDFPDCPMHCSGKGLCELGSCVCEHDQGHYDCAVTVFICHLGCSGRGSCEAGECVCNDGWTGEGCEVSMSTALVPVDGSAVVSSNSPLCPQNCSGRGFCNAKGECECKHPWVGESCDHVIECPNDCSGNGLCEPVCGQCFCEFGWGGVDCSIPDGCAQNCTGANGRCEHGLCFCDSLFEGEDCASGDIHELCGALEKEAPGFLELPDPAVDCQDTHRVRQAVANHWDADLVATHSDRAHRIFHAMQSSECSNRLWRVRERIILLALKISMVRPEALSRYDDVSDNADDICYLHAQVDERRQMCAVRDNPNTESRVAGHIQMLIQQCNLLHSLVFNFRDKEILRQRRALVKEYAVELTALDPTVLNFDALGIDDLLVNFDNAGRINMLIRRSQDSPVKTVPELGAHFAANVQRTNELLDAALADTTTAINGLYSMGALEKYLKDVLTAAPEAAHGLNVASKSVEQSIGANASSAVAVLNEDLLTHGIDVSSLVAVMVVQNTGERVRDELFLLPMDNPERLTVTQLIGNLNVVVARGQTEIPKSREMYAVKQRIKTHAKNIHNMDPAAIDSPDELTPTEVSTVLVNPDAKEQLRSLQSKPALTKTVTACLHELNVYQTSVRFLIEEAKRLSFALRMFDESLVGDCGIVTDERIVRAAANFGNDPASQFVINAAKEPDYAERIASYVAETSDFQLTQAMAEDVKQFADVMQALGEHLPRVMTAEEVAAAIAAIRAKFDYLIEKCGMPPINIQWDTASTTEIIAAISDPEVLEAIREIADQEIPVDASTEEQERIKKCKEIASALLDEIEVLVEAVKNLLALFGELAEQWFAATKGRSPKPHDDLQELLSEFYDQDVWSVVRGEAFVPASGSNETAKLADTLHDVVSALLNIYEQEKIAKEGHLTAAEMAAILQKLCGNSTDPNATRPNLPPVLEELCVAWRNLQFVPTADNRTGVSFGGNGGGDGGGGGGGGSMKLPIQSFGYDGVPWKQEGDNTLLDSFEKWGLGGGPRWANRTVNSNTSTTRSSSPWTRFDNVGEYEVLLDRLTELTETLKELIKRMEDALKFNAQQGAAAECLQTILKFTGGESASFNASANQTSKSNSTTAIANMAYALHTPASIEQLMQCIDGLPHDSLRNLLNRLLDSLLHYMSYFTEFIDGRLGGLSPDCAGNGIKVAGSCVCKAKWTGKECNIKVTYDQGFSDGWRKGFKSAGAVEPYSKPDNEVLAAADAFDRAAALLKSTAIHMAQLAPTCEVRLPTNYLSALEILERIEDGAWLAFYSECRNSRFQLVLPDLLKQAALLRREYDDVASAVKHFALRCATADCESVDMLTVGPDGVKAVCGDVTQALTTTRAQVILDRCMEDGRKHELEKILANGHPIPLIKHAVDDILELVHVVIKHGPCVSQCSKRGTCLLKVCHCEPGWSGEACSRQVPLPPGVCPRNCSGHGTCKNGTCLCDPGWKSADCSVSTTCPNMCSNHGDCIDGKCFCFQRWRGHDCSIPREICPDDFRCLHGKCVDSYCLCEHGWTGDDCTIGDFFKGQAEDGFWGDADLAAPDGAVSDAGIDFIELGETDTASATGAGADRGVGALRAIWDAFSW